MPEHSMPFQEILDEIRQQRLVPLVGPGVLHDVRHAVTGQTIPADSDSLIYALNDGKPMAPKLMYEFPRAAMNVELKKGRSHVEKFLTRVYGDDRWSRAAVHEWLGSWMPPYVIDINRDSQLQQTYRKTPHLLVRGLARTIGTAYRFTLHLHDGQAYRPLPPDEATAELPILFKPMGSPLPSSQFVASDADYVDYITELMGGFALPPFLKKYRENKKYLLLGLALSRDTERMVMSEIILNGSERRGWAVIENPGAKQRRFCERMGLEIIDAEMPDFMTRLCSWPTPVVVKPPAQLSHTASGAS
jgi:hypothetical protein